MAVACSRAWVACATLLLLACGSKSSSQNSSNLAPRDGGMGGATEPARTAPETSTERATAMNGGSQQLPLLCPHCTPQAGGDTSDLGETPAPCGTLVGLYAVSLDEARERGFHPVELLGELPYGIEADLRWDLPVPDAQTRVRVALASDPTFVIHHWNYTRTDCPDGGDDLAISAQVSVSTLDGRLDGVLQARLMEQQNWPLIAGATTHRLHVYGDASSFRGTLDVGPPDRPSPTLTVWIGALTGPKVDPRVYLQVDSRHGPATVMWPTGVQDALIQAFPLDGCLPEYQLSPDSTDPAQCDRIHSFDAGCCIRRELDPWTISVTDADAGAD